MRPSSAPQVLTSCSIRSTTSPRGSRPSGERSCTGGPEKISFEPCQRAAAPGRSLPRDFVDDFDIEFECLWVRAYCVGYVVIGVRCESEGIAPQTVARAHLRSD